MADIIAHTDLPPSVIAAAGERISIMVDGANSKAARVAPCLVGTDPAPTGDQLAEARLVLLGALSRWADSGAGSAQQLSAGPFSMTTDTRQRTGYHLWPSEISDLQAICATGGKAKAFGVDIVADSTIHADTCSLAFGANYCSCGADIAGYPLFEDA